MQQYPVIGIRPIVDSRRLGIRDALEGKVSRMAHAAKTLIEKNVFNADGTPARVLIFSGSIAGGEEAARCAAEFAAQNVTATLSVTPSWCYPLETIDIDPMTTKAIWGFNGTERPGAVYLASALAAHNQMKLPCFSIYGKDVQDMDDDSIPEDVAEKILRFARCALAVGELRNKAYVGFGAVSMGIMGSFLDPSFYIHYLGMRPEWVDMTEILRRIDQGIYDHEEFEKALSWVKKNCREGHDPNPDSRKHSAAQKEAEWEFVVKMTMIVRDIMLGNDKLAEMGFKEEALGRNAIFAGFQGQRMWTDYKPNGDFTEAIMNSSFDWTGKKQPRIFATENDNLNGLAMLFGNLLTGCASGFSDIRCYWSPDAVKRVTGWQPSGHAAGGFIHLINSGSTCLDASAASEDAEGKHVMKPWWEMRQKDIKACLQATDWCPAELCQFRGGGYSSHFMTGAEMPLTLARVNLVEGIGPVLQIAEGSSIVLPEDVSRAIDSRTDPTWPTTWFVPDTDGRGAFRDVYSVMANWGANHGAFLYGHVGADLITLASMLRIPVTMHNVKEEDIFRPHAWSSFGARELDSTDMAACRAYGPLYR
ncbi:MAG: L-fucose isomerase [Lachnospiraceae bacterium]|jgi:L-fucose isomerase|nr:L-fucose isomerase [Lachnospiraceae bacterium]